jgi:hypothetical protein
VADDPALIFHFKQHKKRSAQFMLTEQPQPGKKEFVCIPGDIIVSTHGLACRLLFFACLSMADFNKAIELKPEYGAAYYSRAALYSKLGKEDFAAEDIETVTHFTKTNIEAFANENNVWRSNQLRVEDMLESEINR